MSREKHGRGVEQAGQMLDAFTSLGVDSFDLTLIDIQGNPRGFRCGQSGEQLRRGMRFLLDDAITCQHNVIVRPRGTGAELIQLDDLSEAGLERVQGTTFLILATSVGNHQAWVAVRDCDADFARRLRRGTGADPSASGAARLAGSLNFKRKYAPEFPTVRIREMIPQRTTSRAELERLGLVAPPDRHSRVVPRPCFSPPSRAKAWPSYERCLRDAPLAHNSNRVDVSRADFTFCLLAIDWGWSVAETCQRLLVYSSKARANGAAYARLTAQRAAAVIDRRGGRQVSSNLTHLAC